MPVPNASTGRHRDPRQPQQSQGGGSRGSDHRDRSHRTLSATLLSGSEPDRKVLFQAQGAAPQSRQTRYRCPMEGNWGIAQYGLPKRMHKLLRLLWICTHLNRNRSNDYTQIVDDDQFLSWDPMSVATSSFAPYAVGGLGFVLYAVNK